MSNDFNTTLAAMSAEEKVALLTGSGLWRTASLPQHGIEDIIMTDGTYGFFREARSCGLRPL